MTYEDGYRWAAGVMLAGGKAVHIAEACDMALDNIEYNNGAMVALQAFADIQARSMGKHMITDTVWIMANNVPTKVQICSITITRQKLQPFELTIMYLIQGANETYQARPDQLFVTKKLLVASL